MVCSGMDVSVKRTYTLYAVVWIIPRSVRRRVLCCWISRFCQLAQSKNTAGGSHQFLVAIQTFFV